MAENIKKIKVNFIVQNYFPAFGGGETVTKNVAEYLTEKHNFKIQVFTSNTFSCDAFNDSSLPRMNAGKEIINNVEIIRFNISGKYEKLFFSLKKFFKKKNNLLSNITEILYSGPRSLKLYFSFLIDDCDVIYAISFPLLHIPVSFFLAKLCGRKIIIHGCYHFNDERFDNRINRFIVKKADGYICNTENEYEYFLNLGVQKEKLAVIPPPAVKVKDNVFEKSKIKKELNLPDESEIILYFGQLLEHKNIVILIETFSNIASIRNNLYLILAGSAYAGYDRQLKLKSEKCLPEISKRILFFANVDEIQKDLIFKASDIFVFPSLQESFGIAIIEAWSYKLPVIVSDIEQLKITVKDNYSGLIFKRHDAGDLKNKIEILLKNQELKKKLCENGHNEFLEKYEREKSLKKTLAFINKICK